MHRMERTGLDEAMRNAEVSIGYIQNWVDHNCGLDMSRQMDLFVDLFRGMMNRVCEQIG